MTDYLPPSTPSQRPTLLTPRRLAAGGAGLLLLGAGALAFWPSDDADPRASLPVVTADEDKPEAPAKPEDPEKPEADDGILPDPGDLPSLEDFTNDPSLPPDGDEEVPDDEGDDETGYEPTLAGGQWTIDYPSDWTVVENAEEVIFTPPDPADPVALLVIEQDLPPGMDPEAAFSGDPEDFIDQVSASVGSPPFEIEVAERTEVDGQPAYRFAGPAERDGQVLDTEVLMIAGDDAAVFVAAIEGEDAGLAGEDLDRMMESIRIESSTTS